MPAVTIPCRGAWDLVMDNRRIFLLAAFLFVGFMLYQSWMLDYGPRPEPQAATPAAATATGVVNAAPGIANDAPGAASGAGTTTAAAVPAPAKLVQGKTIHVRTDVLDLVIDTAGGTLRSAELLKYPEDLKDPGQHVRVLDDRD